MMFAGFVEKRLRESTEMGDAGDDLLKSFRVRPVAGYLTRNARLDPFRIRAALVS